MTFEKHPPSLIAAKSIKHLRVNLTKNVHNLYTSIYEILLGEIQELNK